jgi:hypothetical protein
MAITELQKKTKNKHEANVTAPFFVPAKRCLKHNHL